jgi:hypothetical protein
VTTEPIETLHEIIEVERFAIEATKHLGPFGADIDRVCYHLQEDIDDDDAHQDQDEVYRALLDAGVRIERDALADYPWEIWEWRWPTHDWLDHDVPRIFDVLNRFGHGLMGISYEPRGAARHLYTAAFRAAWDSAEPTARPAGYEEEDLSIKAAYPVFSAKLHGAVYAALQSGKLSVSDAVRRLDAIQSDIEQRWPNESAKGGVLIECGPILLNTSISRFGDEHEDLLNWALRHVLTEPSGKAN